MKRVRRREGSRKGSGLGVHIEGLESRRLLSTIPLLTGTVGSDSGLWSVGVNGGTPVQLVQNVDPHQVVQFQLKLYVRSMNVLWRTDGSTSGTVKVAGTENGSTQVLWVGVAGQNLYYIDRSYNSQEGEAYGYLHMLQQDGTWGTVAGIYGDLAARVSSGQLYIHETRYAPLKYRFFSVNGSTATQLQFTNPSSLPAPDPAVPTSDSVTDDGMHFYAFNDGALGNELWKDDGTNAAAVADIFPGGGSSNPQVMNIVYNNVVFFASTPDIPPLTATISGGVLFMGGTSSRDQIKVVSENGTTHVEIGIGANPTTTRVASFDNAGFVAIRVEGFGEHDHIDLSGAAHPATIYGGDGDDTILGGAGNDELDGGAGRDTLDYTAVTESMQTTQYRKVLIGSATDSYVDMEVLLCGSGNDRVSITSYLNSGEDSNTIRYVDGGAGNDQLYYTDQSSGASRIPATLHGGEGDDTLSVDGRGQFSNGNFLGVGTQYYFGDAGNDALHLFRALARRDFNGGDGIDSVHYGQFSTAGGFLITLDDQWGDGPYGLDNVHSDVEIIHGTPWMDTIIGSDKAETLYGGSGSDSLVGNGGDDSLDGYSGNDTLDGGAGNDTLYGGEGVDSFITDPDDEVVDGAPSLSGSRLSVEGNNSVNVIHVGLKIGDSGVLQVTIDLVTHEYALADVTELSIRGYGGDDVISIGPEITLSAGINGDDGNDSITGGAGNDVLNGGDGNDTLVGNGGTDSLQGGDGVNALYQQGPGGSKSSFLNGVVRVYGTVGNDVIRIRRTLNTSATIDLVINGSLQRYSLADMTLLQIEGLGGHDRIEQLIDIVTASKIYGGSGNDTILGGTGADRIYGGEGNDWISGGLGNDTMYGEAGNDRMFGGAGRDYVDGGAGSDVLRGEGEQDRIFAKAGEDDFRGNSGDLISLV